MMTAEMPPAQQKRRTDGKFFRVKCENVDAAGQFDGKRLKDVYGRSISMPRERKDKIGERVVALQQLVSPYGKTDTASVLQEATGYIKFLHEQLQVLSAPYLQKPCSTIGKTRVSSTNLPSLRSRGLCVVPLAYGQQLAGNNGADIWAPNNTKASNF